MHSDSFEQTVSTAVVSFRCTTVVVFKPVVQRLRLVRGVIPTINRLIARGHDIQTCKLLVVVSP